MITDIIWDFDGTLFDTYPSMTKAFKMALRDFGVNESEENILSYMKIASTYAVKQFKEIYKIEGDLEGRFHYYDNNINPEDVLPFPYAKEFCEEFSKNGGRNFIVTHRDKSTYDYLKVHQMETLFTDIITKQNGFKRKPDPEGFLYVLNKYNIDKEKVLVVGDRELEIIGAKNAGIKVCLYNTNNISYEEKPDYTINSINELKNIVLL
ncbi:HAD-IA family hydrolase [Clostridium sp. SYSU_GA19001]|uniref:HAD-IA family hydrolase n=1 Tax=Clostridium caldaquaticum TaxID=2940653 RepID=UPI002076DB82|nr:HAD-IA family hydrolase [Clostridium caldaquaticum]MCM8711760.1 HAD-IA family hydrolase [Clostridium caldaquaticum]